MERQIEVGARNIFITGGGSGIGRAAAILCAKRGDRVAVLDIDLRTAQQTAQDAVNAGAPDAFGLACDVSNEAQVERAFTESRERLGVPYGLFANAGIDVGGDTHDLPLATWQRVLDVNLTGIFLACKQGLRQMLAGGKGGSIVCTSSPCGSVALAMGRVGAYSATKGGISSLVRCMAVDYARFGIRVNAITPGATETGMMWNGVAPEERANMQLQLEREIPLGRLAQPEDPARAALWLLSDESSYVTGSHLVCDGGVMAKASISV